MNIEPQQKLITLGEQVVIASRADGRGGEDVVVHDTSKSYLSFISLECKINININYIASNLRM